MAPGQDKNVLRAPALALLLIAFAAVQAQSQPRKFKEKSPTWPLSEAITVTEAALDEYILNLLADH